MSKSSKKDVIDNANANIVTYSNKLKEINPIINQLSLAVANQNPKATDTIQGSGGVVVGNNAGNNKFIASKEGSFLYKMFDVFVNRNSLTLAERTVRDMPMVSAYPVNQQNVSLYSQAVSLGTDTSSTFNEQKLNKYKNLAYALTVAVAANSKVVSWINTVNYDSLTALQANGSPEVVAAFSTAPQSVRIAELGLGNVSQNELGASANDDKLKAIYPKIKALYDTLQKALNNAGTVTPGIGSTTGSTGTTNSTTTQTTNPTPVRRRPVPTRNQTRPVQPVKGTRRR